MGYGFAFFGSVIEGGTAPLGVTFAVLTVLFILVWGRRRFGRQPLLTFFFMSYALAVVLFAVWGIWHRGLPQFSQVGIIK